MNPKLLLRVASVVMMLHTIGHSIGALTWKQAPNAAIAKVVQAIEANYFDFYGRQVSLGMFFQGYGIGMIFVHLLIVVTLWLLSGYPDNVVTQKLLPVLIIFLVCFAVSEWIYFFPMPATMSSVAALVTAL